MKQMERPGVRFLLTVLLLLVFLPMQAQRRANGPLVFMPEWAAQSQFAGYYAAMKLGYYQEEGVEVEILHPFATQYSGDLVKQYPNRIFLLPLTQAMKIISDGTPLVNILQTSMNSSLLLVSRNGSDPLTLRRAKVVKWRAGYALPAEALAARLSLDYEWITSAYCTNLFLAGAIDATVATTYAEYYQLLHAGHDLPEAGIYRFADHGYNIQEEGVYMTRSAFRRNSDMAERFARASRRGWEWVAEHQEEAIEIVMELVRVNRIPTNLTLQRRMLTEVLNQQLDPDTGERTFELRPDMVEKASTLLLEAGIIQKAITLKDLLP